MIGSAGLLAGVGAVPLTYRAAGRLTGRYVPPAEPTRSRALRALAVADLRRVHGRRDHRTGQYALLIAMVAYTMGGIALVAGS